MADLHGPHHDDVYPLTVPGNIFEPKRQNRFFLKDDSNNIPAWIVRTASRPSTTTDSIEIDYLNTKRYLAGKTIWNTISLGLYDPITPSAAQAIMNWIRLQYETLTGRAGYPDFYKKDLNLELIDPVGASKENWQIKGAFITEATFGDLDYASADPVTVDVTIQPDSCILEY